jgi:hypothetical protein
MRISRRAIRHEPAERRNGERVSPPSSSAKMRLLNGRDYDVSVESISQSGAAILTEQRPAVGSMVLLAGTWAKVVRHFAGGIAVEFAAIANPSSE